MGGAGHSGVEGPQATAARINFIRSNYDGAPSGYIDLAVNSAYNGAPYDFKPFFDSHKMWVVDGKAYRNDYPANVVWGGVAQSTGASLDEATLGAKFQGFLAGLSHLSFQGEDRRDTAAINRGYTWDDNPSSTHGASGSWAVPGMTLARREVL